MHRGAKRAPSQHGRRPRFAAGSRATTAPTSNLKHLRSSCCLCGLTRSRVTAGAGGGAGGRNTRWMFAPEGEASVPGGQHVCKGPGNPWSSSSEASRILLLPGHFFTACNAFLQPATPSEASSHLSCSPDRAMPAPRQLPAHYKPSQS